MRRAIMAEVLSRSDSASAMPWWRTLRKPVFSRMARDAFLGVEALRVELVGVHAHLSWTITSRLIRRSLSWLIERSRQTK